MVTPGRVVYTIRWHGFSGYGRKFNCGLGCYDDEKNANRYQLFYSESLHSGCHGIQSQRDVQLYLHAGQRLAFRGTLLQNIEIYSNAEYKRFGVHTNGDIHRQMSYKPQRRTAAICDGNKIKYWSSP